MTSSKMIAVLFSVYFFPNLVLLLTVNRMDFQILNLSQHADTEMSYILYSGFCIELSVLTIMLKLAAKDFCGKL